ncbi:hypothetical protein EFA46_013295 (plasmid) [Halarchaeum sp. CBA1220]|uniref:hypothetical protein n=1 Tax=Halarchaeum sp. CBA1220 TaxID=1853682 RepID=UPI000F3A9D49|nr:hypothetical protein [Halarchaeum sp. CBA1220]QLC35218.1 hypothetical protein EFA46_013295 [Halarchaeum sp. CBA1220]
MEWRRRRTVRACGLGALAALTGTAGCLDSPGSPLRVERVWLPKGGDATGQLSVQARIANPSASRASTDVYLYADVGDDTLVRREHVRVPADSTTVVAASFDVAYEEAITEDVGARADIHTG